jgi:hypothetical protein
VVIVAPVGVLVWVHEAVLGWATNQIVLLLASV